MGLSTHILDTSRGKPAPNVAISLYRETDSSTGWAKEGEGHTDSDGRYRGFFADEPTAFRVGTYKLRFEVGQYYEQLKTDTLYPFVEIVFTIKDASQHYHIPLLLNPFGYSTYRGS
ncbi:5-hydroxyisourate hydrolase [Sabethes cyaneus]|uniref:5-hydroxyisourate hydrolase n=1 Tax=Sabethes cyaneus TaxID=53552 RepID=UPI00237D853E|nr:5-hydroxyisourate hydrolase [Sabethes cyaneus]